MTIFDSHTHAVARDTARYPWAPGLAADHDWHVAAPIESGDLIELARRSGVDRIALVQAMSCYGFDNRYAIDSAGMYPDSLIAIGIVADAVQLEREVAEGLRGVRIFAVSDQMPGLDDKPTLEIVDAAMQAKLAVLLMVLERTLASVGPLARRFPEVSFVLDHCGFSTGDALVELAPLANVHLKVSSITLGAVAQPGPFLRRLADRFGADRLMWGSDYPHTHHVPYEELVEQALQAAQALSDAERTRFLAATAGRIWPR